MLKTWGGRSQFSYTGSVENGTSINFGTKNSVKITAIQFSALRKHFLNRIVPVGTSRTDPPADSIGRWLQDNVTKTAIASYVAPILVNENFAKREGNKICITR